MTPYLIKIIESFRDGYEAHKRGDVSGELRATDEYAEAYDMGWKFFESHDEIYAPEVNDTDKPKQINFPDYTELKKQCQGYIDDLDDKSEMDESEHYIFEAAMECFYGKNVWTYINKRLI